MERNEFSSDDSAQSQSAGSTSGGFGNTGNISGTQGYGAGSANESSTGSMNQDQGITDRARDLAGSAQEKLADVGSSVRERAGNAKDSLAGALESGADRLRQRVGGQSGSLAGATSGGSTAIANDGRMAQVGGKVASGMDATAQWLRDADLDGITSGIEQQVRDHPGRTLLMAVGVGYLLGKALRK
ncbi:MAG TPA: hypothetical protein VHB25_17890 [Gemmatimonadaceae bacterium]|nr:hypothetical protein [Gemmatimonadaceae bacterium]